MMVKIQQVNENIQGHLLNLNNDKQGFNNKTLNTNSLSFTKMSGTSNLITQICDVNQAITSFNMSLAADIKLLDDYSKSVIEYDNQASIEIKDYL